MFDWLFNLLGLLLSFFNSITGSYALALLFYALVFKIVLLPFNIKQQKNQVKMAKLTPKIELIKAKYKGRRDQQTAQKMQQEILELQQREGASPFSGCLPLLIQLPIIMLLYTVIQNPISHIAQTTSTLDAYNNERTSLKYEDVLNDEDYKDIVKYYGDIIRPDGTDAEALAKTPKGISKDDVILITYNTYAETMGYSKIESLSSDSRAQITLASMLTNYVASSESDAQRATRIAEIDALGIKYDTVPNFDLFGMNLGKNPSFSEPDLLLLIPFVAAAFSWVSMWLTRKMNKTGLQGLNEQDKQAQQSMLIMDLIMPLMTVFIAFNMPGMLGVYWIYQSILGLFVSFIMSKALPLPRFTEEDIKEIRRAQKEAEKANREYLKTAKHRSRHYIDEDDYDELPEVQRKQGDASKSLDSSDAPQIKD